MKLSRLVFWNSVSQSEGKTNYGAPRLPVCQGAGKLLIFWWAALETVTFCLRNHTLTQALSTLVDVELGGPCQRFYIDILNKLLKSIWWRIDFKAWAAAVRFWFVEVDQDFAKLTATQVAIQIMDGINASHPSPKQIYI